MSLGLVDLVHNQALRVPQRILTVITRPSPGGPLRSVMAFLLLARTLGPSLAEDPADRLLSELERDPCLRRWR